MRCGIAWLKRIVAVVVVTAISVAQADEPSKSGVTQTSATTESKPAAQTVQMAYKLKPGQFVHYSGTSKVTYHTELNVEDELRSFDTSQSNETGSHFRVITVDEEGIATIEPVLDHTRMTAKMPGKPAVTYDSKSGTLPPAEFQAIRDSIGKAVARFQVAPTGKLVKAIIIDDTAPKALQDAAQRLETRFPYLLTLPETPVSVGDKWREEYSVVIVNEGLKQPVPVRRIYELTGLSGGVAKIKFRTLVLTPLNEPELEKQIIQQTPTGSIEFDVEKGLVRSYTSTINRGTINAFGPRTLLQVSGESTEKLVTE